MQGLTEAAVQTRKFLSFKHKIEAGVKDIEGDELSRTVQMFERDARARYGLTDKIIKEFAKAKNINGFPEFFNYDEELIARVVKKEIAKGKRPEEAERMARETINIQSIATTLHLLPLIISRIRNTPSIETLNRVGISNADVFLYILTGRDPFERTSTRERTEEEKIADEGIIDPLRKGLLKQYYQYDHHKHGTCPHCGANWSIDQVKRHEKAIREEGGIRKEETAFCDVCKAELDPRQPTKFTSYVGRKVTNAIHALANKVQSKEHAMGPVISTIRCPKCRRSTPATASDVVVECSSCGEIIDIEQEMRKVESPFSDRIVQVPSLYSTLEGEGEGEGRSLSLLETIEAPPSDITKEDINEKIDNVLQRIGQLLSSAPDNNVRCENKRCPGIIKFEKGQNEKQCSVCKTIYNRPQENMVKDIPIVEMLRHYQDRSGKQMAKALGYGEIAYLGQEGENLLPGNKLSMLGNQVVNKVRRVLNLYKDNKTLRALMSEMFEYIDEREKIEAAEGYGLSRPEKQFGMKEGPAKMPSQIQVRCPNCPEVLTFDKEEHAKQCPRCKTEVENPALLEMTGEVAD